MNTLLALGLSNVAVATVLALLAWTAGRWLRRPALTHGLWLLVFLKLLTPPIYSIAVIRTAAPPPAPVLAAAAAVQAPLTIPRDEIIPATLPPQVMPELRIAEDQRPPRHVVPAPVPQEAPAAVGNPELPLAPVPLAVAPAPAPAAPILASSLDWSWLPQALTWTWLTGAALWLALATVRLVRFQRLLRWGQSAPPELRALADGVAARMQVVCPRLVLVPGAVSPMLWVFGRVPRLVLPAALVERLTPEQWRTLLAHELAHWRRRDHWVRWLELAALGLYWWCPLVWWAKQQLQQAEEECCDAWVVTTLPEAARDYALALVETVDFLSGARTVLPPAASGLGHVHLLRRRLIMILRGRTPRALTLTGLLAVLALGLVLLPLVPTWAQDAPRDGAAAQKKEDKGGEKADPDKARQELQKLQDDFIKLQRQMEDKRRELEEKLHKEFGDKQQDLMKRMQEAMHRAGFPGLPGGAIPLGVLPGGPPGGLPGGGFARNPGGLQLPFAPQPGAFPNGNFQPGGFGPFPGAGQPRPDLERRLDDLERKIDKLMERLGGGGGKVPDRKPGDPNAPPPPRKGPGDPNAPPRGGAGAAPALVPGAAPPAAPPEGKKG